MGPGRMTHIVSWFAVAAWAAVIFSMSALPGSSVPGKYGTLAHYGEYAVLGALLLVAIATRRALPAAVILTVAVASAYGITDELHQAFITLRMPDPVDWLVDTAGAASSASLIALAMRARHARHQ